MKRRRCRPYAIELDDGRVYVGSTARTPRERYATHKRGGRTSVRAVQKHGRRLRPDLVKGASSETEVRRRLKRRGVKVIGNPKPFRPSRRKR
jgi:predicted GIY-YIG superfamily endonuclease